MTEADPVAHDANQDRIRGLTAAEVAELLGVKRQTVYAYVSRGILSRQLAMDGRTSVFDRSEVEELRLGRRPEQEGEMRTMLTTRITRVSDDGVLIRGRDLLTMVNGGAGFIEVADLLWDSPGDESWSLTPMAPLGEAFSAAAGEANLLEQLRILLALQSCRDPMRHDLSQKGVRAAGRGAIVAMATGLRSGRPRGDDDPSLSGLLWSRLGASPPTPPQRRAVDVALALLADHGLAASTFAARIAASVRADPYSVLATGLGALGGPFHGAASADVHELYLAVERGGDAAAVIGDVQRRSSRVPGFGHAIYRSQDPRYGALMATIVDAWSDDRRLQTVFRVRDVVGERSDAIPNVDLALGALTYLARMPVQAGEAIFAISRTAGWLAHAMEEYEERPLRFRPKARYIGDRPATA